jgi:hypothetical protein
MTRLIVIPLGLVALAFMIFAIVDIAMTDKRQVRALNKPLWLVVVLLPIIGPILWFFFGRGRRGRNAERTMVAPDDDLNFLRKIGTDEDQDERIRRLEQELSELDDDTPPS